MSLERICICKETSDIKCDGDIFIRELYKSQIKLILCYAHYKEMSNIKFPKLDMDI